MRRMIEAHQSCPVKCASPTEKPPEGSRQEDFVILNFFPTAPLKYVSNIKKNIGIVKMTFKYMSYLGT